MWGSFQSTVEGRFIGGSDKVSDGFCGICAQRRGLLTVSTRRRFLCEHILRLDWRSKKSPPRAGYSQPVGAGGLGAAPTVYD
jgi:hypothetical protein